MNKQILLELNIGREFGRVPKGKCTVNLHEVSATMEEQENEDLHDIEMQAEQLSIGDKMAEKEGAALLGEPNSPSIVSSSKENEERNSNQLSESYFECRICRSRDEEPLISPCKCSGSSKWIHQSCLVQWFQISRATKCELCSEKIIIKKFLKPLREWKRPNSKFGSCSKVDLWYAFVTLFSVGTIIGFAIFHSYVGSDEGMETTVVFIAIYVLCTLMIAVRVRYFYHWCTRRNPFWDEWRVLNQEWDIQQDGARPPETKYAVEESVV